MTFYQSSDIALAEVQVLLVAGAALSEVQVLVSMAGAVFGEVEV